MGDRNAIIVSTRVSAYGNDYTTKVTCPACAATQNYSFNLNSVVIYHGEDSDMANVVSNGDGTFNVQLERTKVTATFKLLTGRDEKKFLSAAELDKKQKVDRNVTRQLAGMIVAVNGDSSAEAINYLVHNLPAADTRQLRLAYRLTSPNIDMTQHFECSECDHEQDMEVPLNADFFWPDR